MTTPTLAAPAAGWEAPVPDATARRVLAYAAACVRRTLTDWAFLAFVIALPTTMYLVFSAIFADRPDAIGAQPAAVMMVTMATYGGLGAAMSAGAETQSERSTGWFRQLMITPLRPWEFFAGKVVSAVMAVTPALLVVLGCGVYRGVRMPLASWLATYGLLMVALLPMALAGIALGLWLRPQVANAATTLTMLALSMVGGLWFPLDMMPAGMQQVGRLLPSYWAAQIGLHPLVGGAFPVRGVAVIVAWVTVLAVLGVVGYRRALRVSRR